MTGAFTTVGLTFGESSIIKDILELPGQRLPEVLDVEDHGYRLEQIEHDDGTEQEKKPWIIHTRRNQGRFSR